MLQKVQPLRLCASRGWQYLAIERISRQRRLKLAGFLALARPVAVALWNFWV